MAFLGTLVYHKHVLIETMTMFSLAIFMQNDATDRCTLAQIGTDRKCIVCFGELKSNRSWYSLISGWQWDPKDRPTFHDIVVSLENMFDKTNVNDGMTFSLTILQHNPRFYCLCF